MRGTACAQSARRLDERLAERRRNIFGIYSWWRPIIITIIIIVTIIIIIIRSTITITITITSNSNITITSIV